MSRDQMPRKDEVSWGSPSPEAMDEPGAVEEMAELSLAPAAPDSSAPDPVPLTAEAAAVVRSSIRERPEINRDRLMIQQTDESSPLHSVHSFEELNLPEPLLRAIYDMKFVRPSRIQGVALPAIIGRPDWHFVGQAQSGTGKTVAFCLSILSRVDASVEGVQALCVCPTRELARQIDEVMRSLAKYTTVKAFLAVPGYKLPDSPAKRTGNASELGGHAVVIGTPGTVWSLIRARTICPQTLRILVFDEADKMVNMEEDLWRVNQNIRRVMPKASQICLFSATYANNVQAQFDKLIPNKPGRTIITLPPQELALQRIKQFYMKIESDDAKYDALCTVLSSANVGSTVIFVATIKGADDIGRRLVDDGFPVSVMHGGKDMDTSRRDQIMDGFRTFKTRILVSTDVLSRGIDVNEVTLVVNFDLPLNRGGKLNPETYLHRIGRSGRFGRDGLAISFIAETEANGFTRLIKERLGTEPEELTIEGVNRIEKMLDEMD